MATETSVETKLKSQGRGRSNSLPAHVVDYLKAWLMSPEHIHHPYPTEQEKAQMVADTGIELKRLNNWFVNNRIRYWKPRMEALQRQESRSKDVTSLVDDRGTTPGSASSWLERIAKVVPEVSDEKLYTKTLLEATLSPSSVRSVHSISDCSSSTNGSITSRDESAVIASRSPDLAARCANAEAMILLKKRQLSLSSQENVSKKRFRIDERPLSPRDVFSRKNERAWRDACVNADRKNDTSLPTMEEAALLFGFSRSQ